MTFYFACAIIIRMKTKQLDWDEIKRRAQGMTLVALRWSAEDAYQASLAADQLESAGCRVDKTGGYYLDEVSVYRAEIRRREMGSTN